MEFTSAALASYVEANLDIIVGESTNYNRSVTDEPYVVVSSGGEWPEIGQCPAWHPTKDHALVAYLNSVEKYRNPNGVLYWRTAPEITTRSFLENDGNGYWREVTLYSIYSRFLVSDKRVLEAA